MIKPELSRIHKDLLNIVKDTRPKWDDYHQQNKASLMEDLYRVQKDARRGLAEYALLCKKLNNN